MTDGNDQVTTGTVTMDDLALQPTSGLQSLRVKLLFLFAQNLLGFREIPRLRWE